MNNPEEIYEKNIKTLLAIHADIASGNTASLVIPPFSILARNRGQATRATKSGNKDALDYHPGGGDHKSDYWKVYRNGEVQGRIGPKHFEKYERIVNSPVFVDGVLMNAPK